MSMGWLKYCLPGIPQHLTRFQEAGSALSNTAQVDQLVKATAARVSTPLPVAKECICSILKPYQSNIVFNEMAARGKTLYSCRLYDNTEVEIWSLESEMEQKRLHTGGFLDGNLSHYRPGWG
jgi:hypothetical protein